MQRMARVSMLPALVAASGLAWAPQAPISRTQAFAAFRPAVDITADDLRRLDRRGVLVRILPADDRRVAVFAAAAVRATAPEVASRIRRISTLKRSEYVTAIARFSDPPRLDDLADLVVPPQDLADLADCRPGACGLKLTAGEMSALRATLGERPAEPAASLALRHLVLERVQRYLASGRATPGPLVDGPEPVDPDRALDRLLDESAWMAERWPDLVRAVREVPRRPSHEVDSFLYWSVERLGRKPVVIVTHVHLFEPRRSGAGPELVVLSRQVFAMHYTNAAIALSALVHDGNAQAYFVYLNQTEVDALGGWLGRLKRAIVERRIRGQAERVIGGIRGRLEQSPAGH
jgi:hypothetical protein